MEDMKVEKQEMFIGMQEMHFGDIKPVMKTF